MDGSVLAVGAYLNDGGGNDSGHVRVYKFSQGQWRQRGSDIDGSLADWFGNSLSLSADGSVLAVGAGLHDGPNGFDSGQVRVFEWTGASWIAMGSPIYGAVGGDRFGGPWENSDSVAISADGTVVAAGAPANDGGGRDEGDVRIFAWSGSVWFQRGPALEGDALDDNLGQAVSLSADGSIVGVGARRNDFNGGEAGVVRVFRWNGNFWTQLGADMYGQPNDWFGESLSLSGDGTIVAVGAFRAEYCQVLELIDNTWAPLGQAIRPDMRGGWFAGTVRLSRNGDMVVIGGRFTDSANGRDSGTAKVFRLTSNGRLWVQVGQDLDGEFAGDHAGWGVAISGDGSRVAVGSPHKDGSGLVSRGQVRVFELN